MSWRGHLMDEAGAIAAGVAAIVVAAVTALFEPEWASASWVAIGLAVLWIAFHLFKVVLVVAITNIVVRVYNRYHRARRRRGAQSASEQP